MKQIRDKVITIPRGVTPCVGVWIETALNEFCSRIIRVTPCVGVWIETQFLLASSVQLEVTPCVGVWIETYTTRGFA